MPMLGEARCKSGQSNGCDSYLCMTGCIPAVQKPEVSRHTLQLSLHPSQQARGIITVEGHISSHTKALWRRAYLTCTFRNSIQTGMHHPSKYSLLRILTSAVLQPSHMCIKRACKCIYINENNMQTCVILMEAAFILEEVSLRINLHCNADVFSWELYNCKLSLNCF